MTDRVLTGIKPILIEAKNRPIRACPIQVAEVRPVPHQRHAVAQNAALCMSDRFREAAPRRLGLLDRRLRAGCVAATAKRPSMPRPAWMSAMGSPLQCGVRGEGGNGGHTAARAKRRSHGLSGACGRQTRVPDQEEGSTMILICDLSDSSRSKPLATMSSRLMRSVTRSSARKCPRCIRAITAG